LNELLGVNPELLTDTFAASKLKTVGKKVRFYPGAPELAIRLLTRLSRRLNEKLGHGEAWIFILWHILDNAIEDPVKGHCAERGIHQRPPWLPFRVLTHRWGHRGEMVGDLYR
jgi:hypothetical protein